ncbi:TetR/AcrR family transcriptional regulator [uncultured Jatrophihabitans sp.]|uniref:TetR/AcrR family transcriptional regulator n=1 Tax=uncultured Jatrophihabitans sp. TaxID=1610747 RepID=UPI0035CA4CAB
MVDRDVGWTDGRSSRWDDHRAARREQLIDAAVVAIKEFGTDAGMDQIAAAARTSKPVIYRYFADKNELYRALGERVIGVIARALQRVQDEAEPQVLVAASIDAYLQLLADNPELFQFVTSHRSLHEARPGEPTAFEFARPVAEVLTTSLGRRLAEVGLDPRGARPWGEAIVGFIEAASLWWIEHPDVMTRDELRDYLSALLWGGVAGVLQGAGQQVDPRPAPGIFAPLPADADA